MMELALQRLWVPTCETPRARASQDEACTPKALGFNLLSLPLLCLLFRVVDAVSGMGLTWQPAFGIILVLYFYSHYLFASGRQNGLDFATSGCLKIMPKPTCCAQCIESPATKLFVAHKP